MTDYESWEDDFESWEDHYDFHQRQDYKGLVAYCEDDIRRRRMISMLPNAWPTLTGLAIVDVRFQSAQRRRGPDGHRQILRVVAQRDAMHSLAASIPQELPGRLQAMLGDRESLAFPGDARLELLDQRIDVQRPAAASHQPLTNRSTCNACC